MSNTFLFANNVSTTLAQSVSATATTINVASGDGSKFPSPGIGQTFALTLVDAATGLTNEICYCTSRSSDQLTVIRAQENTTAKTFSAGDTVALYVTAGEMSLFPQAGLLKPFDYTFAQTIGGYAQNALVADPSVIGKFWCSTTSSNMTTPGSSGANWVALFTNFVSRDGDTMNGPLTVSTHNGSDQSGQLRWGGNLQGSIAGFDYNSYYLYMAELVNQYPFADLQVNGSNGARTDFHFRQDNGRIETVTNVSTNNPTTNTVAFLSDFAGYATQMYVNGLLNNYATTSQLSNYALLSQLPMDPSNKIEFFTASNLGSGNTWVTFPQAFSSAPIVMVGALGQDGSTTDTDYFVWGATGSGVNINPRNVRSQVQIIAIGPK